MAGRTVFGGSYSGFGPGGVVIGGLPLVTMHSGNIFWVDSNASRTGKGTERAPFATIGAAIDACTASKYDTIICKQGHAETLTAAAGIAISKIGIQLVGLGTGASRPTISLGTLSTTTVTVTAANVGIYNMRFVSTLADVVTAINLTAAGFTCEGCFFGDSAVDLNLLSAVKATSAVDGNANGIRLVNNQFMSQDAATLGFVIFTADVLGATIEDNVIVSEGTGLATIFTCATGKDIRMASVQRNRLSSKATGGNLGYSNDTVSPNNSGIIAENFVGHADVTTTHTLGVVGGARLFNNLSVSTDALQGFLIPTGDVDN